MKKHLALLLVLLMIGAMVPVATVAAAVVKPAMQAAVTPKSGIHIRFPTDTSLYATNYHPPKYTGFTVGGTVTYRVGGVNRPLSDNPVQIQQRVYNPITNGWGVWKPYDTWRTSQSGGFARVLVGVKEGHVQFKAVYLGSGYLLPSTSNVIDVYYGP